MREKKKGEDVREEVHSLRQRLFDFQDSVAKTNNNFGERIGALEAGETVQEEQYDDLREKPEDIKKEVAEAQREQKGSIAELRKEHKESMDELKKGNKEILDIDGAVEKVAKLEISTV